MLKYTYINPNITFTVGWGWLGHWCVAGLINNNANLSKAELAAGRCQLELEL